jgi:two-component system, NtrC family, nitrogen regulation sensor histidine kinase NtrY
MMFRRKLLAVFALTVFLSVATVAVIVSAMTRRSFERANTTSTAALVAQFRREFSRRGEEVVHRVETIAASETTTRMALKLSHGTPDYGAYLNEAKSLADNQQLDFLDFVDSQGTIISSAQSPATFGYKENFTFTANVPRDAFLKPEEISGDPALALSAVRQVNIGDRPLYVIGGRRLDQDFLASLELPAGMRAMLYRNVGDIPFTPQFLTDASGPVPNADRIAQLIEQVERRHQEATSLIHWSSNPEDDETIHAIPLTGQSNQLLGILLVGSSRRPYVELRQHIRSASLLAAGAGMILAILLSGWAAARVTRPVEQLAQAAREVADGNWNTQVTIQSTDELGELAASFNRMTHELLEQKERLVQTERVAAWRELARRLAHELKNPLFPLQLTVENLLRARQQSPEQFEETFQESSSTLLAEISNLKTIISRFSEFSRMPQPRLQRIDLNEIVQNVARLFQAQLHTPGRPPIECKLELAESMEPVAADPELMHRVLSNLVLNAMDAMPEGGVLTLRTHQNGQHAFIEVSDTGTGLTPEECERLFTPYYTSKSHGTGLGLAMVQSVISDHGGRVSVRSETGRGTTFEIELPGNTNILSS